MQAKMKCAIYTRVSTDNQAALYVLSLENQDHYVVQACEENYSYDQCRIGL